SELGCGRRTAARLGHGVVAIYSGLYWIINTLVILQHEHLIQRKSNGKSSIIGMYWISLYNKVKVVMY
ncbi:hypothetical protein P4S84_02920, partial [Aneurinibacillus aneurinilyticus]|nr:hypothetical protein [Aneurinibacillus aneurinilyticus]